MDFDEEGDSIISLLLVPSDITNLLSILPNQDGRKCGLPWLQCRSTESVYHNIMLELKLQDHSNYRKYFSTIVKLIF